MSQDRPDFAPPPGDDQPPAGPQPTPPPPGPAQPRPTQPPPGPQGYPGQPGPAPYPHYPHWAPESAPMPEKSGGSIIVGILLAFAIWIGGFLIMTNTSYGDFNAVMSIIFVVWLVLSILLTARQSTRRTGAGMFIAAGLGPLLLAALAC